MRSSKNEFIKPAGRVKLAVLKNYDLRRVPGLCKYGHNFSLFMKQSDTPTSVVHAAIVRYIPKLSM